MKLSPNLQPLLEAELALGNEIERVDEPAGTLCPLAVILRNSIHFGDLEPLENPEVERWQNYDPHYPLEAGYKCKETNHVVAGPQKL